MKRLLYILLLCTLNFVLKAQYPVTQNLGSSSSLVRVPPNGAMQASLVNRTFFDTTAANLTHIDYYAGSQIFTTSNNSVWIRNEDATAWILQANSLNINQFFNNIFGGCNNLLQPGYVTWSGSGLTFDVSAAVYSIGCRGFTSAATQVTLANGDASLGRFDVIYADTNGTVGVLQGTPSANPQLPQINPASQIELDHFLVPAGATNGTDLSVTQTVIYDQNLGVAGGEWDGAATSWTIDRDNTTTPFHLTKCAALSGSSITGSEISWSTTDTMRNGQFDIFKFYIRLTDAWNSAQGLDISFYNGSTKVSNSVLVMNNSYGFNIATTGSYQTIVIPMLSWVLTDSIFFKVVIKPVATPFSAQTFRLDWIQLQGGLDQTNLLPLGSFIWNQYSVAQPANYWIAGAAKIQGGITSPDINYVLSERYGYNAIATGIAATAVGAYSRVTGNTGTALGDEATSTGGLAVGYYARSGGTTNIAIGGTTENATSSILIGRDGDVDGNQSIGLGQNVTIAHNNSIALGYFATTTATNQFIVGSNLGSNIINTFYLGSVGVSGTEATDVQWAISGESGTNQDGHLLAIMPGLGTGNSTNGGSIIFKFGDAGVSGTTLQTATEKVGIRPHGSGMELADIRFQEDLGANVASANDLTLGRDGNLFHITGATQINAITTTDWSSGAVIGFIFDGAPLVKNNTAGGGGTAPILLAGRTDFQAAAGDFLSLRFDGTNWYEANRALAGGAPITDVSAANGLTESPTNTIRFGGTLDANTTVNTGGFTTTFTGTNTGTYSIRGVNTGATIASVGVQGESASGIGVSGSSTSYFGVQGTSSSGSAVYGSSTSGAGVVGVSSSSYGGNFQSNTSNSILASGNIAPQLTTFSTSSLNTSISTLTLIRSTGASVPSNGVGGSINFEIYTDAVTNRTANQLISKWTTVADATRTSQLLITGVNSASTGDIMAVDGTGVVGIGITSSFTATRLNVVDNSVGAASIVDITTTSTAAASNSQKGVNISLSGANATASQTTYGIYASNTHSGASATNYGVYATISNGSGSGVYGNAATSQTGVTGVSSSGAGVNGTSGSGNGVQGTSTSSVGGSFNSSSNYAVEAQSQTGVASLHIVAPSSTNSIAEVVRVNRQTSGTPANGIGASVAFHPESSTTSANPSASIASTWTDVNNATRTGDLQFWTTNSASSALRLTIAGNGSVTHTGRHEKVQGADVASAAGAIALGLDGNVFEITGTSAITLISNLNWQNGSEVTLVFTSTASLVHGTASSGTDITLILQGASNFSATANDSITLTLCEIGGTQQWVEKCRSVN